MSIFYLLSDVWNENNMSVYALEPEAEHLRVSLMMGSQIHP